MGIEHSVFYVGFSLFLICRPLLLMLNKHIVQKKKNSDWLFFPPLLVYPLKTDKRIHCYYPQITLSFTLKC